MLHCNHRIASTDADELPWHLRNLALSLPLPITTFAGAMSDKPQRAMKGNCGEA